MTSWPLESFLANRKHCFPQPLKRFHSTEEKMFTLSCKQFTEEKVVKTVILIANSPWDSQHLALTSWHSSRAKQPTLSWAFHAFHFRETSPNYHERAACNRSNVSQVENSRKLTQRWDALHRFTISCKGSWHTLISSRLASEIFCSTITIQNQLSLK